MTENQDILLKEGKMLPVMEHFYTIQGEGAHTGKAAYFIRLGGCDVGCHFCFWLMQSQLCRCRNGDRQQTDGCVNLFHFSYFF